MVLLQSLTRHDDESATKQALQKQLRDLQTQLEECKDDLESEKEHRAKAENRQRDIAEVPFVAFISIQSHTIVGARGAED